MCKNARAEILMKFKRTDNYKKMLTVRHGKNFASTAQELILTCQLVIETVINLTETAFDYILKAVGKHCIVINAFILTQRRTQAKYGKQTTKR